MEAKSLWVLLTTLLFIIQGWPQTEGCLEQERIALFQLKSFFDDSRELKNWVNVKGSNCCQWKRVECNITTERVIGLDLNSTRQWNPHGYLNLSLFLPFEELKTLYLTGNGIADLVDNQVSLSSAFNNLEILVLSENYFNDSVLSKLKSLTNLKTLNLSFNSIESFRHFQGEKVQPLMNLEELDLSFNLGIRTIGISVLNNLTKLKKLDLSYNRIESLQSAHDDERSLNLTNLEELNLDSNFFNNSLLAQLNELSNLKSLNIWNNFLSGSLNMKDGERSLSLTNLEELNLDDNYFKISSLAQLNGFSNLKLLSIQELLNSLSNLEELNMSQNEIKEFVPIKNKENGSLGKLKFAKLDYVFINGNASLIQLLETFSSVKTLYLRGSYFNDPFSTKDQLHVSSKIEELVLDGSDLNNNILQSIGVFSSLKVLSLRGCGLNGTLPTQGWCD